MASPALVDAASNALYVYHHDGTGHTVAITNAAQQTVNTYAYDPYGRVMAQSETVAQPFKYAGQVGVFAEGNNLYYMRARYYDASVGRFISEDPIGFAGGLNLYAYVGGNPVMLVDPSGLEPSMARQTSTISNLDLYGTPWDDIPFVGGMVGATKLAGKSLTYLYQKVGSLGEHLKFGITNNPSTRYATEELAGGQLKIIANGTRKDMLQLERNLHETLPIGPEEGQKFYIQKQIDKGLKPPPYD